MHHHNFHCVGCMDGCRNFDHYYDSSCYWDYMVQFLESVGSSARFSVLMATPALIGCIAVHLDGMVVVLKK